MTGRAEAAVVVDRADGEIRRTAFGAAALESGGQCVGGRKCSGITIGRDAAGRQPALGGDPPGAPGLCRLGKACDWGNEMEMASKKSAFVARGRRGGRPLR